MAENVCYAVFLKLGLHLRYCGATLLHPMTECLTALQLIRLLPAGRASTADMCSRVVASRTVL